MTSYKCFNCNSSIDSKDLDQRFICPNCGSRIFYKPRTKIKTVSSD